MRVSIQKCMHKILTVVYPYICYKVLRRFPLVNSKSMRETCSYIRAESKSTRGQSYRAPVINEGVSSHSDIILIQVENKTATILHSLHKCR